MGDSTLTVHALDAGHFTLPEKFFVHPADEAARRTVPSLAFLIQHHNQRTDKTTRIVFDLGLRRDINRYPQQIQKHLETRHPLSTDPDVVKSLARGGLTPDDIDYVIYSHVHWDHVGEPRDFPKSTFVVGKGAVDLLAGNNPSPALSHSVFESDLLDPNRTIELTDPSTSHLCRDSPDPYPQDGIGVADFDQIWSTHVESSIPFTAIDLFRDGTLYIIDAPGHLPGHINLLAKTARKLTTSGTDTPPIVETGSMYLAGDACHDRRIVRGEKEIGEWIDPVHGVVCCIHTDKQMAEETIQRIRRLERGGTEVVLAHDFEWEEVHRDRFWGA
ncbi:hypothetical protein AJ79_07629 [Helicocarpus griseus UAMH5409]|uniref:Metallo-beta-lactamase domain-containing protein n=1 Tax=Helicocarpus griseus UAMH5409 TaxID=1447875 RepID=A0A2B7X0D4_9EURO|nr:hypothetical protein AJ79_07629 [Helicocarpus griseus UAMH5409]